jgi:hypothetical protein
MLANTSAPSRLAQNFSAEDPEVDHLEDQAEDHPEEEPLHPYPLAAVAVEAEAAAAEVEARPPTRCPTRCSWRKIRRQPPNRIQWDRSLADEFMNAFNLYRLTNVDTEQMLNPMKRQPSYWASSKVLMSRTGSSAGPPGSSHSTTRDLPPQTNVTGTKSGLHSRTVSRIQHPENELKINYVTLHSSRVT